MTLDAYLREHPDPTEDEVKRGAGRQPVPLHGLRPIIEAVLQPMKLRSQYDREILLLALPALGALAAEPLYVLVDTAIVGHLGTTPARLAGDRGDGARRPRSRSSTSSPTARRRRSRACTAPGATTTPRRSARRRCGSALGIGLVLLRAARALAPAIVEPDGRRGRGQGRRGAVPADLRARRAAVHARQRGPGLPARDRRPAHAAADPGRRPHRQRRASSCCSSTASTGA